MKTPLRKSSKKFKLIIFHDLIRKHLACVRILRFRTKSRRLDVRHPRMCKCESPLILGQTLRFVNCNRIPQLTKFRFVAESATLLFFFDLLCCFGFHGEKAKTLYCSKSLQKQATLQNPQQNVWNPEPVCGI